MESARSLALVGLMGSGKSAAARALHDPLGLPVIDVDDEVRARTGLGVRELWERGGEEAYRPLELEVVLESLDASRRTILAAPGGVILEPAGVAALAQPHVAVVYLRVDPAVLADDPQPRPLLGDAPLDVLRAQQTDRDHRYAEIADLVVDATHASTADVVDAILDARLVEPRDHSTASQVDS